MDPNFPGIFVKRKIAIWSTLIFLALFVASILITYFASSESPKNCKPLISSSTKVYSEQITCKNILCNNPFKLNGK